MMNEQQRTWAAVRAARNLTRGHAQFGVSGLMTHLDDPQLLALILPADPLAPLLEFNDGLFTVLPERFTGVTANGVQLLGTTFVTDSALGRCSSGGDAWRAYVALRRDGGVEIGIGSTARYPLGSRDAPRGFAFRLCYIVHAIRVAIESQARVLSLAAGASMGGPFELVVALPDTAAALLGSLADGWQDPSMSSWDSPVCITDDVLVRRQFDEWPMDSDEQLKAITAAGDQVCNAFGTTQRLFAPRDGEPGAGRLSPTYA